MKMACAHCNKTIHTDIEYVDIIVTHYFDDKRINQRRTQVCPECAPGLYHDLGFTAK